jgi:hypothetical protein
MTEAQHIAAIELEMSEAVANRERVFMDDIDAAALLKELARLRSNTMDFADVFNQLAEYMGKAGLSWSAKGLVAFPNLLNHDEVSTNMGLLPYEYVKQSGDCDYGFYGDSYFPTTYSNGDGGVLYLHVSWTE